MAEPSVLIDELRGKAADVSDPVTRRTYENAISKAVELGIDSEDDLLNALMGPTDALLTACWVAGELRLDKATPVLWRVIDMRPDHAIEAAKALLKLREPTSTTEAASFANLLESSVVHPTVRVAAAYALGQIGSEVAVTALTSVLNDRSASADIRGHCAEALGNLRAPSAFSTLIDTLRDDEAAVRFWSAYALGELGDERAASALKELAERDPGHVEGLGTVREEAREALSMLRSG